MQSRRIIFIGILLLCGYAATAQVSNRRTEIQHLIDSLCKSANYPGLSCTVVYKDGRIENYVTGYADSDRRIKMAATDRLMEGSVGKTYVAAIAMNLIASGKMNLNDKVVTYLGRQSWYGAIPNADDITIGMLMNHTSGIMRYEFKDEFTRYLSNHPNKTWRPEELLHYIMGEPPRFPAGKGWEYADTNYILLGMIIEQLTGKKYYQLLQETLLSPLGLHNTAAAKSRRLKRLTQGYAGKDNSFGNRQRMIDHNGDLIINPQFEWTGGGLYTTTEDLARWCELLYQGKAFPGKMLPVMLDGVDAPMLGTGAKYGLGVIIKISKDLGTYYGHSGFFPGYLTEMYYFPNYGASLAVQVNTSDVKAIRIKPHQVLLAIAARTLQNE